MSRKWAIAGLVVFVLVVTPGLWRLAAVGGSRQAPVPLRVAQWHLLDSVSGEAAVAQLTRLHGRPIGVDKAYIARYGSSKGEVMLWVGRVKTTAGARQLIDRMRARIAAGAPFKLTGRVDIGRPAYELIGMGQRHYLYRRANKVIWLSVDRGVPRSALVGLARKIR